MPHQPDIRILRSLFVSSIFSTLCQHQKILVYVAVRNKSDCSHKLFSNASVSARRYHLFDCVIVISLFCRFIFIYHPSKHTTTLFSIQIMRINWCNSEFVFDGPNQPPRRFTPSVWTWFCMSMMMFVDTFHLSSSVINWVEQIGRFLRANVE